MTACPVHKRTSDIPHIVHNLARHNGSDIRHWYHIYVRWYRSSVYRLCALKSSRSTISMDLIPSNTPYLLNRKNYSPTKLERLAISISVVCFISFGPMMACTCYLGLLQNICTSLKSKYKANITCTSIYVCQCQNLVHAWQQKDRPSVKHPCFYGNTLDTLS